MGSVNRKSQYIANMILNNVKLTELRSSTAAIHLSRRDTTVARCMPVLVVHLGALQMVAIRIHMKTIAI